MDVGRPTMFRAKSLYLTEKGKRPVAGILESGKGHVKFTPNGQPARPGAKDKDNTRTL